MQRNYCLDIRLGSAAAARIRDRGWSADIFGGMIGASGGPKWLILSHIDRVLADVVIAGRTRPLTMVGSSIGAWRHAMLAQSDPRAAIGRFESAYLQQHYVSEKPPVAEITAVSRAILDQALPEAELAPLVSHPLLHSLIVTARARGLAAAYSQAPVTLGFGLAALGNILSRQTLPWSFQRVVFSTQPQRQLPELLGGFSTAYRSLSASNVKTALMATGAIPGVLAPQRDIDGAQNGCYWDGGIIDYHFDTDGLSQDTLWLYPHFSSAMATGWFDKFLPWRAGRIARASSLVHLAPTPAFLSRLPFGKIPDRRDFQRLDVEQRRRYWRQCVDLGQYLAEDLRALWQGSDPLDGVSVAESY